MRDAPPRIVAALLADEGAAPRLALAAWLDAQPSGRPRADLIRLQCDPSPTAKAAADALLDAHAETWAGAVGLGPDDCTFRRGFIEEIDVTLGPGERPTAARFEAWLPSVELPSLRALTVRGGAPHPIEPGALAALARMSSLEALSLVSLRVTDEVLAALLETPTFARLRRLEISRGALRGLGPLGHAAPALPALEELRLDVNPGLGNAWDPDAADVLGDLAPLAPRLRVLTLGGCLLSAASLRALAALDLRSLRLLDVSGNPQLTDPAVVRALAAAPSLADLEVLRADGVLEEGRDVLVERFGSRVRP